MPKTLREFSSGGIVFKKEGNKTLWLIRKTTASKEYPRSYWMLPKGWIDDAGKGIPGPMASGKIKADQSSLQATAVREVEEEAGVKAEIVKLIGTSKYSYTDPTRGKILKFATFYLMKWSSDLPEGHDDETSEIAWLPYEDAVKTLSFGGEKQMLRDANKLLTELN
jgi:8-oxo-dGTP pyrophosphatase MutT (NUDIX family)